VVAAARVPRSKGSATQPFYMKQTSGGWASQNQGTHLEPKKGDSSKWGGGHPGIRVEREKKAEVVLPPTVRPGDPGTW